MKAFLFLALLPFAAFATTPAVVPPTQTQAQQQGQNQSQQQEQAQSQAATSVSNGYQTQANNGNTQGVTFEDRLQAPGMAAPAIYASGPCTTGWSAGASGPGAGLSFGKAKADPGCERRELARVMSPLNPTFATAILCLDPMAVEAEKATGIKCQYVAPIEPPKVVNTEELATKRELQAVKEELTKDAAKRTDGLAKQLAGK
jgi:hypothetical protein